MKMDENSNTSNGSECSVYDTYPYVIVAAVSSGSAMVSALCCVFVIGLIFLFKKHYFFIQRLILYHCLATLFRSTALILRLYKLGHQTDSSSLRVVCIISAFIDQVTLWYFLLDFSVITFTLLMTAVLRKNVARLEGLFIVLIFIFPLTFNWIPFINNSYGRFQSFCWIRNLNYDNCTEHEFGTILQYVLWFIPFNTFLIVMIPMYIVVIAFVARQKCCRRRYKVIHDQDMETLTKTLNKEVWPLLFFPFGELALLLFPIASGVHDVIYPADPSYGLNLASSIFSPLQGGYIALVYTLDCGTLRRLTYSNLVATICKRRGTIREYPVEVCERSDSVLSSERHQTSYRRFTNRDEHISLQHPHEKT